MLGQLQDAGNSTTLAPSDFRGRLVESAVGAYLAGAAAEGDFGLYYWREGQHEVDYVVEAVEVRKMVG